MPPLSENRIVRLLQSLYPATKLSLKKGIGDDAAVILPPNAREYWLVTSDMLLEDIDFRREWATPRELGCKSVAVNLSDLAAMGARPRFYTVSLALPQDISERWILDFYRGLAEVGDAKGACLIGGDLSSSRSGILISITAFGESLKRRVLYRVGGKPGDLLYVTGVLGASAAGLKILQSGCIRPRSMLQKRAVHAHRNPEPRCAAGLWLAQSGLVHCMMDLSDGLSADLPRMCAESGVGAEIDASRIPAFLESSRWNFDPLDLALNGGEDYELLFAVSRAKAAVLEKKYPADLPKITRIGEMTFGSAIWLHNSGLNRRRLPKGGFDHFESCVRRRPGMSGLKPGPT
jgi:thiamine-monophosphate kinase